MFSLFNKSKPIEGEIGYYNLQDWWLTTFTQEERDHVEDIFRPLGADPTSKPLTEGKISSSSQKAAGLLSALAGWFYKPEDRYLAKKIIQKAYEEAIKGSNILDLHFTLQGMVEIYYRDRDTEPDALNKAIQACEEQIKIAPQASVAFKKQDFPDGLPAHTGYDQLRIIYKKQGEYQKAIALCEQAKKQGWNGDWDKKIEELKKLEARHSKL